MSDIFTRLQYLHEKSIDLVHKFEKFPEKDIKRKHIELLSSQIAISFVSLRAIYRFQEIGKGEFEEWLNNKPEQIENYIFNFKQSMIEAIMDTALYQTELVLRVLYSKLTGRNPAEEKNINQIIATLFEDIENKWQKEEARLFVLFWTMRNTIHTGGIYYKKPEGQSILYKGKEYKFEFMKSFKFLEDNHIVDLLSDFLDSVEVLLSSKIVTDLGYIEHPAYQALA